MKNVTKSFDYHQPDMSVNRSVYASCLSLDSVIGQLKGQLTRRACVSGQNALCACAVLIFHICRIALSALYTTGPSTITDQILSPITIIDVPSHTFSCVCSEWFPHSATRNDNYLFV